MKKFFKSIFLITIVALLFVLGESKSQMMPNQKTDNNLNFFDIQKSFYDQWGNKEEKDIKGFKQFKRWEYFWQQRTYPTGKFPDALDIYLNNQTNQKENSEIPDFLSVKWKSLGPYSVPTDVSGHQGIGRVNSIRINPLNQNEVWLGSAGGGLWKSSNGGNDWVTFPFTQFLSLGISDIGIAPSNPKIVYVATGDMYGSTTSRFFYSIGLIKTIDGGNSWQLTSLKSNPEDKLMLGRVLVHPANPNIVFVASNKGIFKTTDGGVKWNQFEKNQHFIDMEFKPKNANMIYASTYSNGGGSSVFVSNDAGETWKRTLNIGNGIRIALATTDANDKKVYALAASTVTFGFNSLNVSIDEGETWERLSDMTSAGNILGWYMGTQNDTRGQGFYDLCIAATPDNQDEIFVGGINLWKSADGGKSFTKVSHWVPTKNGYPYIHADQHDLVFGPDKKTLFCGNDGGIDVTTNKGVNWSSLSKGLNITQYYRIGVSQTKNNLVIAGAQDNGTSIMKSDLSWSKVNGADGMECIIDYTNPDRMYSSIYNGSLYRSINGGANFSNILNASATKESGAWITPFVLNPVNPRSIYAGYINIWKSDNYGGAGSWKKISGLNPSSTIQSLIVAPSDTNVIYAASVNQLFATYDGGESWNTIHTSYSYITYIAVDFKNPRRVWITKSGFEPNEKVIELIDSNIVRNLTGNLPNVPVNTIVLQKDSPDRLYIGTDIGVYVTDYNSGYWEKFGQDLPSVNIQELEIQENESSLFVATYGRGLWSAPLIKCKANQPEVEAVGNLKFCPGDSILLRAKKIYPNYLWSTGDTTKQITVTSSGSYSLFVDDGSGCFGRSEQFYIPKSIYESIEIATLDGEYLCPDGSLSILAAPVGFSEYRWSNGDTTRQITIKSPGYYSVIGISPDGCVVESKEFYVEMKPAPQKPIINQEGRTLIAPYATAYQWYLEGKRIFNSTSREHYIQDGKIGNYTVLVYNEFNCSTLSDEFQVITSVDNNILNDFIVTVNNNPGTGDYLINFSEPIVGGLIILVTDVNGREIASITENLDNLKNYRLNLTQFSTGIYFANIKANGQSKLLKLIRN